MKRELDFYECRHGLGYTSICGERGGVRATLLAFVPLGFDCEVHRLRLENRRRSRRRLTVFSCVEFCLWDALDDMTNFQRNFSTGEVLVDGSAVYHLTEYRERRNHFSFYWVNAPIAGCDTDREAFVGLYNGYHAPQVPLSGQPRNSKASGWSPIASHCVEVELEPGQHGELVFLLGYVENPEEQKWTAPGVPNTERAIAMQQGLGTSQAVAEALVELRAYWDGLLAQCRLTTGDEKLARMVNVWNPYQTLVTFNLARSASYFESGIARGIGFRDANQDLLGVVQMVPDRARRRLLDLAATQLPDGSAYHQYRPLTKEGNDEIGAGFNDDPLWLIMATDAYAKETGDLDVLQESVPFGSNPSVSGTLLEHLRRGLQRVWENLGPHGLPLIGRADWNDCLNLNCFSTDPDESFQTAPNRMEGRAESVLLGAMFVLAGRQYAELCRRRGLAEEAERAGRSAGQMRQTVMEQGWDGEWFLRALRRRGAEGGQPPVRRGSHLHRAAGVLRDGRTGAGGRPR